MAKGIESQFDKGRHWENYLIQLVLLHLDSNGFKLFEVFFLVLSIKTILNFP
jgi:hypothetical protein